MVRARIAGGAARADLGSRETSVLTRYISMVSILPFVEEVRHEVNDEGVSIVTVIDAEPFAFSPREHVYEAELRAADVAPDALVSFRLVNRREYGDEKLSQVLSEDGHVAWRRAVRS